jgi:hypothetical protein
MAADDIERQVAAIAESLAGLPADQQRRWLLHLLQLLDQRAAGTDEYLALLSRLTTDMRQRISLGQW